MSIVVKDRARWHRTKLAAAGGLFGFAVAAGSSIGSANPLPAFTGFVVSVGLFTALAINIIRDGEW